MMMYVLYMIGMVAVALKNRKENSLNNSGKLAHRPSLILFYSFSDPCEPQVSKLSEYIQYKSCKNEADRMKNLSLIIFRLHHHWLAKNVSPVSDPFLE